MLRLKGGYAAAQFHIQLLIITAHVLPPVDSDFRRPQRLGR
jgi:hypothetical protein